MKSHFCPGCRGSQSWPPDHRKPGYRTLSRSVSKRNQILELQREARPSDIIPETLYPKLYDFTAYKL
jgi:hypothetical protein